jgi:hypothetical protein
MTKFKIGVTVIVDDCYLNDEVTVGVPTSKTATVIEDANDDDLEGLIHIKYESGLHDYVPRNILTVKYFYYDVHVEIPKSGYSVGIKSLVELTDEAVIKKAFLEKKFEEDFDKDFVDSIEEIEESEYNEWFTH